MKTKSSRPRPARQGDLTCASQLPKAAAWARPATVALYLTVLHGQADAQTRAPSSSSCPMNGPAAAMQAPGSSSCPEARPAALSSSCPQAGATAAMSSSCPSIEKAAALSSSCPSKMKAAARPDSSAKAKASALSSSCPGIELKAQPQSTNRSLLSSSCPAREPDALLKFRKPAPATGSPSSRLDGPPAPLALESSARIERAADGSAATMRHAFGDDDITYFLGQPDCHAVVSHGPPQQQHDAASWHLATEHAPVFLHGTNTMDGLALAQVLSIVRGDTTTWEALGGSMRGAIHLHFHGGELQHPKLLALLRGLGVSRDQIAAARPRFHGSYEALDAAASADPQALVIGLKTSSGDSLKMVPVAGVLPMQEEGPPYALALQIHLLLANSGPARDFAASLVMRLHDNRDAFDAYIGRVRQYAAAASA